MALGLYTVLPGFARWDDALPGLLMPCLPVVGVLLGALWLGVASLAGALLPAALAAVVIALAMPLVTGFLHLDGLMDVSDAVLSARSLEDKRRILKDPHTGSFAVIALFCLLAAQIAAAHGALEAGRLKGLLFLPVVSRALAALALQSLPPMEGSHYGQMAHEAATPGRRLCCLIALGIALVAAFYLDWRGGAACAFAIAGFALACLAAARSLSGMNGDIAGCGICCAELAGLIALACL